MSKIVLTDAYVKLGANTISDHVAEVKIETSRDEVNVTAMGATNKQTLAGLGDATITVKVFQDFAASSIDSVLWPLSTTNTPFTVYVRPTSGAISTANPEYTMSSLLFGYTPINGKVGDASEIELTFKNVGSAGLARATS